jgi:hypothetical protein
LVGKAVSRTVALRVSITDRRAIPAFAVPSRRGRWWGVVLAGLCCAVALGGCGPRLASDGPAVTRVAKKAPTVRTAAKKRAPAVNRSLLAPQPEPDCKFRGPVSNPITAEETRMKLDYEQQCYRQAEGIVRSRLDQLQNAVETADQPARRRRR